MKQALNLGVWLFLAFFSNNGIASSLVKGRFLAAPSVRSLSDISTPVGGMIVLNGASDRLLLYPFNSLNWSALSLGSSNPTSFLRLSDTSAHISGGGLRYYPTVDASVGQGRDFNYVSSSSSGDSITVIQRGTYTLSISDVGWSYILLNGLMQTSRGSFGSADSFVASITTFLDQGDVIQISEDFATTLRGPGQLIFTRIHN